MMLAREGVPDVNADLIAKVPNERIVMIWILTVRNCAAFVLDTALCG